MDDRKLTSTASDLVEGHWHLLEGIATLARTNPSDRKYQGEKIDQAIATLERLVNILRNAT